MKLCLDLSRSETDDGRHHAVRCCRISWNVFGTIILKKKSIIQTASGLLIITFGHLHNRIVHCLNRKKVPIYFSWFYSHANYTKENNYTLDKYMVCHQTPFVSFGWKQDDTIQPPFPLCRISSFPFWKSLLSPLSLLFFPLFFLSSFSFPQISSSIFSSVIVSLPAKAASVQHRGIHSEVTVFTDTKPKKMPK